MEVFPIDLFGMPPDRDIYFCIDLELGTHPISIPPYRMASVELRELKAQIQELLNKELILALPVRGKYFIVYCNVSHLGLGTILMQDKNVIAYELRQLKYHPGKANMVADALSRKEVSMLGISEKGRVLASIEVRPTFIEEIKAKQFEYENLNELRKKTVSGKAQDTTLDRGIDMAPFEVLYGRGCKSPIGWFEAGYVRHLGVDLVKDALDKGKLSPPYIGPFEFLDCIGLVAYRLALPPSLYGVNPEFHVFMLKKYHGDGITS
ncbi:hypothetical protein MTR67_044784 [Solanum verrucosum]|uniref:Tf2-1-like SH3-like domain-containing protein n=1 Tax=Solanum verrucosum TaxID=315347 RepID=A0AAF0UTA7_SOLVR|nr:hypothetical protein MTR67_044784 [Solanum verrucosum]